MSRRKQARPSRLPDDDTPTLNDNANRNGNLDDVEERENIQPKNKDENEKEDANNNQDKILQLIQTGHNEKEDEEESKALTLQTLLSTLQWPSASQNSLSLEALQSTKVAVAQFAANALAAGAVGEAGDLAVLQSTLFTLQQQQLLQLQLIHQIQQQLNDPNSEEEEEEEEELEVIEPENKTRKEEQQQNSNKQSEAKGLTTHLRNSNLTSSDGLNPAFASLLKCANQDPNRPLSPGQHQPYNVANNDDEQPNTLEMLQKRAQEVLDSASAGLLASSLAADDPRKKLGPYEKGREPFFKHRCRYCGKVFGSDSALQIHIRSHTGERPFKCNVCGSRFTTKGNLKVHFQRHTSKFPHVKMNPHPVPEHLDAFHPPLLSGSNSGGQTTPEEERSPTHPSSQPPTPSTNHLPTFPPPPPFHPFSPLFRFDIKPPFPPAAEEESPPSPAPQDLTKPKTLLIKEEEEQPENLSKSYNVPSPSPPSTPLPPHPTHSCSSDIESVPSPPPRTSAPSPNPPDSPRPLPPHPPHTPMFEGGGFDPAKDPAIYTNLLPRPGSNDNAWESLIEVTKTSETSKLQQLVDNIEHKLTDPNQCIICHRVLSCKSALQMHYRTHTGERPFKCKICGRAFTTKGNLKTHMGVHRAKPPLRVLHQCPVCHKRFTNSLVLQQHIRLHTGEPTDLTPDQIRAAEVRDPYPSFGGFGPFGFPHPLNNNNNNNNNDEGEESMEGDEEEEEEFINQEDEGVSSQGGEEEEPKPTTSLAALENQVRTITTSFATQMLGGNKKKEEDDISETSSSPGDPSGGAIGALEEDWKGSTGGGGALDLTPRNNNIFNPFLLHQIPPPPVNFTPFSNLVPPPPPPPPHPHPHHHHHHHHHHPRQFSESESFLWSSRGGNTTCQICLKTFACNSALEIHYRSHTKERPFKCNVCERGFSTKGNMKQHMLTHKIRDGTSNSSFDSKANGIHSDTESINSAELNKGDAEQPLTPNNKRPHQSDSEDEDNNKKTNNHNHIGSCSDDGSSRGESRPIRNDSRGESRGDSRGERMNEIRGERMNDIRPLLNDSRGERMGESRPLRNDSRGDTGCERSEMGREGSSPLEGVVRGECEGKHICKVCSKNFSSSSALHIHSRTHTGDRPFKCNVCQKAFTTKGNLKVHMGTHIFSNGVSRRGRRMSLDPLSVFLPLNNPLLERRGDKEARPHELFYPYAQTLHPPIFHPNPAIGERRLGGKVEEEGPSEERPSA